MSVEVAGSDSRKAPQFHFDRHAPEYRERFLDVTQEMHQR